MSKEEYKRKIVDKLVSDGWNEKDEYILEPNNYYSFVKDKAIIKAFCEMKVENFYDEDMIEGFKLKYLLTIRKVLKSAGIKERDILEEEVMRTKNGLRIYRLMLKNGEEILFNIAPNKFDFKIRLYADEVE